MAVYNTTTDTTLITVDSAEFTADIDPFALPLPVTRSVDSYAGLITPWQSTKARFVATVRASVAPLCAAQAVIASLPAAFDIDFAIGAQLDVVGRWVGRSRNVPVPLPSIYFSVNIAGLGVNQGYIKGPFDDPSGVNALPDEPYRRLLYTKIAANSWDGTADGAEAVLATYFTDPATHVFVDDGGQALTPPLYFSLNDPTRGLNVARLFHPYFGVNMPGRGVNQAFIQGPHESPDLPDRVFPAYTVGVSGRIPMALDLYILDAGLIPIKAMGVRVDYAVTTVDGAPIFGVNMDDEKISGVNRGAIAASPRTVAALRSA